MLQTADVTTVKLLKGLWSMSYYTVPHYNHTGTHTTYKHWSTSGNALGKWWVSSGMHPFSRGLHSVLIKIWHKFSVQPHRADGKVN